jgi:hypothetical protein
LLDSAGIIEVVIRTRITHLGSQVTNRAKGYNFIICRKLISLAAFSALRKCIYISTIQIAIRIKHPIAAPLMQRSNQINLVLTFPERLHATSPLA